MANIIGIENMTVEEIREEVAKGGKFVQYIWCVSIIILSFKRPTDIFFIRSGESAAKKGLPFTLLTLFLGWWGVPWGILYSFQCLGVNSSGGYDLTKDFMESIEGASLAFTADDQVESDENKADAIESPHTTKNVNDAASSQSAGRIQNGPVNRSGSVIQR